MGRRHGSQPDLCWLIQDNKETLVDEIRKCRPEWQDANIEFLWPLQKDKYSEYSILNRKLWDKLETKCPEDIRQYSFWPSRGPKWDGAAILLVDGEKILLLFEAKAHLSELMSTKDLNTINANSRDIITESIKKVWSSLTKSKTINDWLRSYQFANRVAHAKKLIQEHVNTHLIYILFCNEQSNFSDVSGREGWEKKLKQEYDIMGLTEDANEINDFYHVIYLQAPSKEKLVNAGIDIDEVKYE